MIHGENKKVPLDCELTQKREIKSRGNKRKSSFLGKREKKIRKNQTQSPQACNLDDENKEQNRKEEMKLKAS